MWSLKATVVWVSYSFFEAKEVEEKISGRKGENIGRLSVFLRLQAKLAIFSEKQQ